METVTKSDVIIRRGRAPESMRKLVQSEFQQSERRPFFKRKGALVTGAIFLGAFVLVADIYTKKATKEEMQDALVMDFKTDTTYARRDNTQLKELAKLCQEYNLSENDMSPITKIAKKLEMAEGEVLFRIKNNVNQARLPSFDRKVDDSTGAVLKELDKLLLTDTEKLLKSIEASGIQ